MTNILRHGHGQQLDHVGIGVPDTEAGVAELCRLTGAHIELHDPEPGQWYWSGVFLLAVDSYVEIVGPNPAFTGRHPMRTLTERLTRPTLMFWYVATDDLRGLAAAAAAAGGAVEHIEWVNVEEDRPDHSRYGRAILGPGFIPQKPCLIQWDRQVRRMGERGERAQCALRELALFHPTAADVNPVLETLGIDARLQPGASRLKLTLDTPNGVVVFENPGFDAL
ncbi:MAG: VOC family protein [Pseudomonadota bacterium]